MAVAVAGLSFSWALLSPICASAAEVPVTAPPAVAAASGNAPDSAPDGETGRESAKTAQVPEQSDSPADGGETPNAKDGWVDTGAGRQYWRNGAPLKGEWLELDGAKYYFSTEGFASVGFQDIDDARYYFASDTGAMRTGWQFIDGCWYWFDDETGAMAAGQAFAGGRWSRFDSQGRWLGYSDGWVLNGDDWYWTVSGIPQAGWYWINGAWYWMRGADGKMATGWVWDGSAWYYMSPSGAMQTGWQHADGHWYYLRSNGAMAQWWLYDGSTWYWLGESGAAAQNEVLQIGSEHYAFGSSCAMGSSGWCHAGDKWYYAGSSGALQTGWRLVNGSWYWMNDTDFAMRTGLLDLRGNKYYLSSSGAMVTGWAWDDADQCWYYATPNNNDGRLLTGWRWVGNAWYWMDPSTAKMQTGWLDLSDGSYYLSDSGAMLHSQLLDIEGQKYWFVGSGLCASGWVDTSSGRFFFDPLPEGDGAVTTRHPAKLGRVVIEGKTYQINSDSGVVRNAWVDNEDGSKSWASSDGSLSSTTVLDGVIYYNGAVVSGWIDAGDARFHAGPDGKLDSGWAEVDGKRYYFDPATYVMKTGWLQDAGSWYWLGNDGAMATGWAFVPNDAWYYLNADGTMKTGWLEDGGKHYYLDPNYGGRMATGARIIDGYRRIFWTNGECDKIGWQNPPQYPQVSSWTVKLPGYCTGQFTYVSPSRIAVDATREDCVNAFISRAFEYIGTQFIEPWSTAPGGAVDCSGLVLQCLYATGMDLGVYNPYNHRWDPSQTFNSMNWYHNNTFMPVNLDSIQRGDIIYYQGHVTIYLGNDQIIDSCIDGYGNGVRIRPLDRHRMIGAARPFV